MSWRERTYMWCLSSRIQLPEQWANKVLVLRADFLSSCWNTEHPCLVAWTEKYVLFFVRFKWQFIFLSRLVVDFEVSCWMGKFHPDLFLASWAHCVTEAISYCECQSAYTPERKSSSLRDICCGVTTRDLGLDQRWHWCLPYNYCVLM